MQRLPIKPLRNTSAQRDQLPEIQARGYAHARKQIGHVFRGHVPACTRSVRTPANARRAGIEAAHPGLPGGEHIGQPQPQRVVEVAAGQSIARDGEGCLEPSLDLLRIRIADGIGEADTIRAGVEHGLQQPQDLAFGHRVLDSAAERRAQAHLYQAVRPAAVAQGTNLRDLRHDVVGRLAQVGQAVSVAGRKRQQDQALGLDRVFSDAGFEWRERRAARCVRP